MKSKTKPVIVTNLDHDDEKNMLLIPFNYLIALKKAGAVPLCLPPNMDKQDIAEALKICDGILLIGGKDYDPHLYGAEIHQENMLISKTRQDFDISLFKSALAKNIPVFGICGGQQLINIVSGGTLYTSVETQHPGASRHRWPTFPPEPVYHQATIDNTSRLFTGLDSEIMVNSYHHQAVKKPGAGLRITAKSADGVIEGIESISSPVFSVQWHPEKELDDPVQQQLFENFVNVCRENR